MNSLWCFYYKSDAYDQIYEEKIKFVCTLLKTYKIIKNKKIAGQPLSA